jgi:hypothetical protein
MHWQQSSGSGFTSRGSGNNIEIDFAQSMQAFTLEGGEPIPTHAHSPSFYGNAPPPGFEHKPLQVKTRESRLDAARRSGRVSTLGRNPCIEAHHAQDFDDNTLRSSPTLSSVSHGDAKPPDTIATFDSSVKVAELCRGAPTAAFLMHYHDTPAFIGSKGGKIKRLRFLSGAKYITVHTDRTYEVDGLQLVLVRVKGHPDCVHKAVQLTESSFEIFPPPPQKASPTPSSPKHRASPSSRSTPSSLSPGSVGRSPASVGEPSHLGFARPLRQPVPAAGKSSPAAKETTYAAVLSGSNRLKREVPPSGFPETEVSADSESVDQWSGCKLGLEEFCREQAACVKGSPEAFADWLRSQDVESLVDLLEAVDDGDFREEMQSNGLKGFKKGAFKKAIQSAVDSFSAADAD